MAIKKRSGGGGGNRTPRVGGRAGRAVAANMRKLKREKTGIPRAARESAAMSAAAGSSNEEK